MNALELLANRRSIRSFAPTPVESARLLPLIEAACAAPAPHHTRPWRFALVTGGDSKRDLAAAMADRWRQDLEGDGVDPDRIDQLTSGSIRRLESAPALILACLTDEGLDKYPDHGRAQAERGMARLSLGAALQNLMLVAPEYGLATCWIAAPIFCPDEARIALDLDQAWKPQALVMVGEADPSYSPPTRPPIAPEDFSVER